MWPSIAWRDSDRKVKKADIPVVNYSNDYSRGYVRSLQEARSWRESPGISGQHMEVLYRPGRE